MRIGLLTSDLTPQHGWGNYGLSVVRALANTKHNLTILAARDSKPIDEHIIHPVLTTTSPPESNSLLKMLVRHRQIATLLNDCDIIHTTVELYAPLVQLIAKKRPIVMTAHGSYINLPVVRRQPISWLYQSAFENSHIVCVSHYTQRIAQQVVPKADTSVIVNAVNTHTFADIIPQKTSYPTIVTLGGVKARKGTFELVQAVASVREQLPDVSCHILGSMTAEPNYVARVKAEINALNLQETVFLHGFVSDDDVREWYSKADVFALPSINAGWKFEGFGLATLEASAAGLPVIGTRDCGAEDAIDHNVTGLLISQDHIREELPLALLDLLTHPDKAQAMGHAGRAKALSHTWDDVAQQLIALYESLL
ncbi:MAG: glycosyltransferase family 4 protein [Phototrophicaceae bacterium]